MKTVSLSGSLRENVGKKDAKVLRKEGRVPGIIYGTGENISFHVKETELNKLVWTPHVNFVEIEIDGKKYKTIFQEMQFHPVTDRVVHFDLLQVVEGKPLTIALPVELHGVSPGVQQGGKLKQSKRKIKVNALADNLPETIKIDINELKIGSSVRNGEIDIDGLTVIGDPRDVIVAVKMARGVVEEEEEEATEEAAVEAEA